MELIIKRTFIAIVVILLFSCEKKTLMEQGIYDIEEMKTYLTDDVEIIQMDEYKYILMEAMQYNEDYFRMSVSGNTVAVSWPNIETKIDESNIYNGRIDLYVYNYKLKKMELMQKIFPPFTQTLDYLEYGNDVRTLSTDIKLSGNYLLANAGYFTDERKISGFEGMTDKKKILAKMKEMDDVFFDKVYLYEKIDNKWELVQDFNADFGDDEDIVYNKDGKIGYQSQPWFGRYLNINSNHCIIYQSQVKASLNFYKKEKDGVFKLNKKYNTSNLLTVRSDISKNYTIWTNKYRRDTKVNISINQTGDIIEEIESPLYPDNKSFGQAVAITDNLAFISEMNLGSLKRPEDNTSSVEDPFPGYVHIYNKTESESWKHIQTLTSPFPNHDQLYGIFMIANNNYIVVTSEPRFKLEGRTVNQPGLGYIYKKQSDNTFKLEKVLIGYPENVNSSNFYWNVEFLNNGLVFSVNDESIRYIPDLFDKE